MIVHSLIFSLLDSVFVSYVVIVCLLLGLFSMIPPFHCLSDSGSIRSGSPCCVLKNFGFDYVEFVIGNKVLFLFVNIRSSSLCAVRCVL